MRENPLNGDIGIYQGSMKELDGSSIRVLGHHNALNGDGTVRYIIAILNDKGNPVQTLSNVRRGSLA